MDTGLKKYQFQDSLPLQLLLPLPLDKKELKAKKLSLMLKIPRSSLTQELNYQTPDFLMPLLFFKLILRMVTGLKQSQFQDLLALPLQPPVI